MSGLDSDPTTSSATLEPPACGFLILKEFFWIKQTVILRAVNNASNSLYD